MLPRRTSVLALVPVLCAVVLACLSLLGASRTDAQTADELRARIEQNNRQLQEIENEIKRFEAELNKVGAEKQTLQKAINALELSHKKLAADIRLTEQKIGTTDLELQELEREISIKELEIERDSAAVAEAMRTIDELENTSLVEAVLSNETLTELWETLEDQTNFRESLRADIKSLTALKKEYERAKDRTLGKREELDTLHDELSGERTALNRSRVEKDSLLKETKNKESNYQKILAEKRKAQSQFAADLSILENQLRIVLDPSAFPTKGSKVLGWPVKDPVVTQGFGLTDFARSGAYGYENGQPKPHRAIDLRASIGTPIIASLAGTVKGAYDMDAVPGCRSYGQWILIEHANGLSTLYTHLSSMAVAAGQKVATGQLIGHSGNTGFSTAPHLHFGVFATQGVRIQPFTSSNGCKSALIPLASPDAYLNPLDYL